MEDRIFKPFPASFVLGLILVCVSLIMFVVSCITSSDFSSEFPFLVTHLLLLGYFFGCWFEGSLRPWYGRRKIMAAFVVLLLIDAYTVNNSFTVFQSASVWSAIMLVCICANMLTFGFFEVLPEWARRLQCVVLGFTFLLPFYLAIYLLPLYLIGVIGLIAIGLSIVTFSPVFIIWFNLRMVRKLVWPVRAYRLTYLWSGALSVSIVVFYCVIYALDKSALEEAYNTANEEELPAWITASQHTPNDFVTEQLLKTGVVYTSAGIRSEFTLWNMPQKEYDQKITHDPLFMTASALLGPIDIPVEDRFNILSVMYDKRHYAADRLWTGKDLVTTSVTTRADIWPQYHLSYTENTYTVRNDTRRRWATDEEAIYTFHLPEGAVVTSLSLWINNAEEKAVLTTQAKADSAYTTIVGKQRRDPSVVHWQEGNRVIVRVFPVPQGGERKFKIGVTAPLKAAKGAVLYEPVWFEGPPHEQAVYNAKLNMQNGARVTKYPAGFFADKGNTIEKNGKYNADWQLEIPDDAIDNAAFSFNGQRYTLLPYKADYEFFTPENFYLDINASWSHDEYQSMLTRLKGNIWAYHPLRGMIAVTDENKETLFDELHAQRFSLFPFHRITNPATALVITSADSISPQLKDLDDFNFRKHLRPFFTSNKVRVFNFSDHLSPYLATLRESRSLIYEQESLRLLYAHLAENRFLKREEDSSQVVIAGADMRIARSTDSTAAKGPDHLARLFAYNAILQELGPKVTGTDLTNETDLIGMAKAAYVVTPLSSLIVLETQEDYDRFKIKEDANSLQNASLKGHGSVPEPHEWALFILAIAVLTYVRFEKLFKRKKHLC
ncbi:XrtN system VIT domain-containing protein [Chitinophaga arvensicola]|uniref:XrtN system VIT domain protein n=1 Tax=Chitinophaga arvensicola TaxID=29529 RepID=A0A1I0RKT3_9BACT|nr:XrtN system VIT domain-containing protein [Chitinophaga arvensicola]SEW40912.1 XrtN system VIT domain protein [Chitinophaga arvensicola]